jgi:hypothetical protein
MPRKTRPAVCSVPSVPVSCVTGCIAPDPCPCPTCKAVDAIPAPPASHRRAVRRPRKAAPAAPPPVVAPPTIDVHHLAYGRRYVTFSGVVGAPFCHVTYQPSGYRRYLPAPEARRIYADLVSRGYVVPGKLLEGTAA